MTHYVKNLPRTKAAIDCSFSSTHDAREIEVKSEASHFIRVIGVFWLASALAAFDFDPWLLHPATVVLSCQAEAH